MSDVALLPILLVPDAKLRARARAVGAGDADVVRDLAPRMLATMYKAPGIGLAAPQVHVPLRLFIWKTGAGQSMALVNPVLEPLGEETEAGWEGCLSIPGMRGLVRRALRLRFTGLDIQGSRFDGEAQGMAARIMQHEYDHLDGVLYPSKLEHHAKFGFNEELARAAAEERAREAQGGTG